MFLVILSSGCSITRNVNKEDIILKEPILAKTIKGNVNNNNITKRGFIIQRADIEVTTKEERIKILGTLKFENPDKFLVSLKSNTGIEFVRIFISEDTLLINDRINKKLYCGSPEDLSLKYGLSAYALPLIIGDYLDDRINDKETVTVKDGKFSTECVFRGMNIRYNIDCKQNKTLSATMERSFNEGGIQIEYDNFVKKEGFVLPGRIKIFDLGKGATFEIRIKRIEFSWNGNIEFVPGKGYEMLRIL